jgi:hypothetical protein
MLLVTNAVGLASDMLFANVGFMLATVPSEVGS